MPVNKLKEFLEENQVKFQTINHSTAYTAQEIAALTHVPGEQMAKTVIVKMDGKMAMVVLPASRQIDFDRLEQAAGADNAELAKESEFEKLFPDCERGAMPPFGNLYDMDVYVDEALAGDEKIAFNAGTHTQLLRMAYADYERLVKPRKIRL